jgi:transglutaminase-like putative cysteine protease
MLFRVTHTTRYTYEAPVSQCLNEVRLTPRAMPDQDVLQTGLAVQPAPPFIRQRKDYFGNDVASFGVFDKHERFVATAESLVAVRTPAVLTDPSRPPLSWETVRDMLAAQAGDDCLAASEFIYNSPYVAASADLAQYARPSFPPDRPILEAVGELSRRVHEDFKYLPKSTSIDMPLSEVLRIRRGVCQDFAHVMIGALRSLRLAARYVSGYVRPGPKVKGAQASHAWISVFVPGGGWIGFDPTNDLLSADSHIILGWGRDYGDVTPVKGVTLGGGKQTVEVEVYVRPEDPIPESADAPA